MKLNHQKPKGKVQFKSIKKNKFPGGLYMAGRLRRVAHHCGKRDCGAGAAVALNAFFNYILKTDAGHKRLTPQNVALALCKVQGLVDVVGIPMLAILLLNEWGVTHIQIMCVRSITMEEYENL